MEISDGIRKFTDECLKEAIIKNIKEPTGDNFDTYGIRERRWVVEE